jgi:hypothetical protein
VRQSDGERHAGIPSAGHDDASRMVRVEIAGFYRFHERLALWGARFVHAFTSDDDATTRDAPLPRSTR